MIKTYGLALIDYNTGDRTCKYLSDFFEVADILPSVIVIIDNYMKNNDSFEILKNKLQVCDSYCKEKAKNAEIVIYGTYQNVPIILIKAASNLGYARANNLAVKMMFDYNVGAVLFSNSDIIFQDDQFKISEFLIALDQDSKILGVGSDVVSLDEITRQSPCKFLTIRDRYWRGLLLWPLLKGIYKPVSEIIDNPGIPQIVYRLIGAFFFVNTANFNKVNGFDEHTFLYAEELILAERGRQKDLYMFYIPGQAVMHEDGITTNSQKNRFNANRLRRRLKSDLYYYKTYIHTSDFQIKMTEFIVNCFIFKRQLVQKIFKI